MIGDRPRTVEQALELAGYWYPPDAIEAVRQGRATYHPIDTSITWPLSENVRSIIQRAIDRVEKPSCNCRADFPTCRCR